MLKFKSSLLAATVVACIASSAVYADTAIPLVGPDTSDAALHGAGASSVQNLIVRNANCIGPDKKLGGSGSATALSTISPGLYAGTQPLDCSAEANNLQPNQPVDYVSTGSGFGRQMWRQFADIFDGAAKGAQSGVFNPFGTATRWNHIQFAFSDAGLAQSELTEYNSGAAFPSAASQAGPAISFPVFVLPVAVAYDSTYGVNAKGHAMVFNAQGKGINSTAVINLTRAAYCGIFNGTINNWNDATIQKLNGRLVVKGVNQGIPLFDANNDTAARWSTDGAPIRLVGRLDKSGTTDVFTRHLAAVCNAASGYAGTNNYLQHAESLPYNAASNGGVDFTSVRSDTNYKPGVASSKYAGTTNMVSGDYFNGTAIVNIASGTPTSLPTGAVGSGLYLVANGGGKVGQALVAPSDYPLHGVLLNGKVGYISADFIQPSVDAPGGLNAASLQVGSTPGTTAASFAAPTIRNQLLAFTQLPPESDANGAYKPGTDTRLVNPVTGTTKVAATRDNPLAWVDVLYSDPNPLSAPATGYPIVGTTQYFGYTCYTSGNRTSLVEMLGLTLGQINKNSHGAVISKLTFGGSSPMVPGIDDQSNIAVVPAAWAAAITKTFLTNGDAGAANLWMQDNLLPTFLPPKAGRAATKTQPAVPALPLRIGVDTAPNPVCGSLAGA